MTKKKKSSTIKKKEIEMPKHILFHLKNIKNSLNSKNEFDKSKVRDYFSLSVSVTYIEKALKEGVLEEKELISFLRNRKK